MEEGDKLEGKHDSNGLKGPRVFLSNRAHLSVSGKEGQSVSQYMVIWKYTRTQSLSSVRIKEAMRKDSSVAISRSKRPFSSSRK